MSLNSQDMGVGSTGSAGAQDRAPRLSGASGYATWAPRMNAYLQAKGAAGIHIRPMTKAVWDVNLHRVDLWRDESLARDLELAESATSSSSKKPDEAVAKAEEEKRKARARFTAEVELSQRMYGIIFSSLPEDLLPQVLHGNVPEGCAHLLWQWLQNKFQSTEMDNIHSLFEEWFSLKQGEAESFDAYRARVNRQCTLLEHAKQKTSPEQYEFILLCRLRPEYKPIVLALDNGELLKVKARVDWEEVARRVNAFERNEQRIAGGSSEVQAGESAHAAFTQQSPVVSVTVVALTQGG